MTRSEMLNTLARYPVPVSIDGSPALDLTPQRARALAQTPERQVKLLDLTTVPQWVAELLGPGGVVQER